MTGKLYWRIKKNGKWTWTPAHVPLIVEEGHIVIPYTEEE